MENNSETQQKETFYKYRKVTKCLSAGISFLTDNFLHIVKLSLPFIVAYAALLTALAYIGSNMSFVKVIMGNPDASSVSLVTLCVLICVILLCLIVVFSLYSGLIFRLIHIYSRDLPLKSFGYVQTLKSSIPYGVKSGVFFLFMILFVILAEAIGLVPMLIPTEGQLYLGLKLIFLVIILVAMTILIIPLTFSFIALFLEEGNPWKNAVSAFKKGFKYWGKIFCLTWLVSLLEMCVGLVLLLPSISMVNCYQAATLSQLNGDPVTIPASFNFWYLVVVFLSFCLISLITWIGPASFSYLYASMKVDEKEEAANMYAI